MAGSIAHLEKVLNIRAGKASPAMLGSVFCRLLWLSNPAFTSVKN
jgi:hypothetical protein